MKSLKKNTILVLMNPPWYADGTALCMMRVWLCIFCHFWLRNVNLVTNSFNMFSFSPIHSYRSENTGKWESETSMQLSPSDEIIKKKMVHFVQIDASVEALEIYIILKKLPPYGRFFRPNIGALRAQPKS